MEVQQIPVPSPATLKVTKEGKQAIFETNVIQTTDNKYIYCLPIRHNNKLVSFEGKGMTRELKIRFAPGEVYIWKNISIMRFIEDGKNYLRIKTTTIGTRSTALADRAEEDE